jgi:uncharacterized pyridoxamine 5'-phosphate oxidase family protein
MSDKNNRRCIVYTNNIEIKGVIVNEYEEIGGPDDGAIFAVIELDNGQTLTVKMSEVSEE